MRADAGVAKLAVRLPVDRVRQLEQPVLRRTWAELRRRKVVRAGAAYVVAAWIVLQLAEITYQPLGLPDIALTWTVLGAVLGLPVVLVLAWFLDVSRRGVARERGAAGAAGAAFAVVVVLLTVGGLGWWLADVYRPGRALARAEADRLQQQATARQPAAPVNSVAVLPFGDMSPGRDQQFLGDGLAEELLDRLARSPDLRVAARTSSFAFRDQAADVASIAARLNVRWIVEGSVRKDGGRIRVTAQLIDAADGFHAWSQSYEHDDQDLFALQDAVTDAIAKALSEHIGATAIADADSGAADPAALEAYLRGRAAWRRRTPVSLDEAEAAFRLAVELDPGFARAWSGLADTYLLQMDYGSRPLDEAVQLAEPAAVRAVALGPQLGEAWASVGLLRMQVGQLDAARRSLEQAVRLDPRYEMAPLWLALTYGRQGEYALQRDTLERALALNPLEPIIHVNLAEARVRMGDAIAAREQLLNVLAITPEDTTLLRGLALVERSSGRLVEARQAAERALQVDADAPASLVALAQVLLRIEDFDGAAALIARLPQQHPAASLLAQERELRAGGNALHPALASRLQRLPPRIESADDRDALELAGAARLRAGADAEAASLLARAAGEPADLAAHAAQRLDAASLLLVALERSGDEAAAAQWRDALAEASDLWLDKFGDDAEAWYARALAALRNDRPDAALAALETAAARGFSERWLLRFDPRLQPLRDHPQVRALASQLEAAFAQARQAAAPAAG